GSGAVELWFSLMATPFPHPRNAVTEGEIGRRRKRFRTLPHVRPFVAVYATLPGALPYRGQRAARLVSAGSLKRKRNLNDTDAREAHGLGEKTKRSQSSDAGATL